MQAAELTTPSSQMIPCGRLLPKSERPIRHFHRLVHEALAAEA
jgi:hypothetical protein